MNKIQRSKFGGLIGFIKSFMKGQRPKEQTGRGGGWIQELVQDGRLW